LLPFLVIKAIWTCDSALGVGANACSTFPVLASSAKKRVELNIELNELPKVILRSNFCLADGGTSKSTVGPFGTTEAF
jgi:hypothetical protein